jgi:hypothetical protein
VFGAVGEQDHRGTAAMKEEYVRPNDSTSEGEALTAIQA